MGAPHRRHHRHERQGHLRAEGRRGPRRLVDDRDQHRRLQVSARPDRHARARDRRPRNSSAASPRPSRDWGIKGGYFASDEDAATFHDELAHLLPTQKVAFNSPVWFNVGCDRLEPNSDAQNWHWDPKTARRHLLRHRLSQSAVLGLLHQLRRRLAGLHPDPGQDRGHALQVGIGHRHQPLAHPRLDRNCSPAAAPPPAR